MTKKLWKKKIKQACEDAGTYKAYFDSVIDTLAGIMEMRDDAMKRFKESGSETVVTHVNTRGGGVNITKNPALVIVDDFNKTALAYWRDLGLTPAGLKRINEGALKGKQKTSFGDVLKDLGI